MSSIRDGATEFAIRIECLVRRRAKMRVQRNLGALMLMP